MEICRHENCFSFLPVMSCQCTYNKIFDFFPLIRRRFRLFFLHTFAKIVINWRTLITLKFGTDKEHNY